MQVYLFEDIFHRAFQSLWTGHKIMQLLLFKQINFRQNTAIWTQPMRTHNLTQAQAPASYARSIQSRISLSSKLGKHGTLAWIAGTVLLRKAFVLLCLKFISFNNRQIMGYKIMGHASLSLNPLPKKMTIPIIAFESKFLPVL